ncbi:MAG: hypothetical protein ABUT20_22315 [Bacteroidota bacterium]
MKSELIYRQLTAFVLLAAFLAQTFSRTFVIADYYTNTAKYAKNCINKARPQMHCNGKCQMMKKLQEQEKKDQENQERKSENKNEILLSSKSFFATVPVLHLIENNSIKTFSALCGKSIDRSLDIFHPPQA